jgi:hypothetical protein
MDQTPDTGVSQTAPPPVPDIASLSPADRQTWRLTGEAPKTTPADSSPAPSGDQSVSTDTTAAAASEPAKPAETKPPKNAETRIQELLAERAQARAEANRYREALESLRRTPDAKPAESSPAKPSKAEWQRYREHPDAPKVENFDTYEDYLDARATFIADQRYAEREQVQQRTVQRQQLESEIQTIQQTAKQRLDEYAKTDSELSKKVDPGLLDIPTVWSCLQNGITPGPENAIIEEITKSEAIAPLAIYFSTPEGQKEFGELVVLGRKDAAAMLRRFGRIEAKFEKRAEASAEPPPLKTVSTAPAPPTVLGKKPAEPADEAKAAMARGDFAAYKRILNERERAALRT